MKIECPYCDKVGTDAQDEDTAIAVLAFHIDENHWGEIEPSRMCYLMAKLLIENKRINNNEGNKQGR